MENQDVSILLVQATEQGRIWAYISDGYIYEYDVTPLLKAGGAFRTLRDPQAFFHQITFRPDSVIWLISAERSQCPVVSLETILRDGRKFSSLDDEVFPVLLRSWQLEHEEPGTEKSCR